MEPVPYKRYPVDSVDYKRYEEIGEGCSATVYRALCIPFNEIVAIKVLDLERCNNDLDGIRREVHTMSLIEHPKVLRALCSFTAGHDLWVVMPYMAGGSCLHIMKSYFPEGFEEPVIATLLRETLVALAYLHAHGHIHRDVKAGNILLDTNGTVKLADFGVSACMFDTGDRHRSRNTFVGTPCWMAPEVMQQVHGYEFRADIWSFGITALELAHGHAPFSKYPPMKVLLMTLQNAPPGLDQERDKKFSKSFKDLVAACLVKDPKKRPTAEKLLKHSFFRSAKDHEYLARTIVEGLSPLGERFRMLKEKEAELVVQNKALFGDKEQLSQQEYIRGISAWNFNLDDLKNQAALIQDNDTISSQENLSTDASNSALSFEDGVDDMGGLEALDGSLTSANQPLQSLNDVSQVRYASDQKYNNALLNNQRRDTNNHASDPAEDSSEGSVVRHKGRFKVTSADRSPKGSTIGPFNPASGNSTAQGAQNVSSSSIIPSLQFMLQQNNVQKDEIVKLIKCVESSPGNPTESVDAAISENFQASAREGGLKTQVIHLQQRIGSLVEELQRQKLKNAQLERHLSSMVRKE